jgi:hypothetical protein
MDDGILNVKLVPSWNSPNIRNLLRRSLSNFELLQAGIAYWTVDDNMFGGRLSQSLAHKDGFLCVDLHPPTDVDSLAALATKKCHVYFYCEDITTYSAWGQKEPPYLVRSKLLLFWSNDGTAELWVGSHNWTNRAILGLNVESSLVVTLHNSSRLFFDALEYLAEIKAASQEFELSNLAFYKQLQRKLSQKAAPVIELEGKNPALLSDSTIGLFGTDTEDLKELGTIDREVHVSVSDTDSGAEYFYPASIVQSGHLPGISFEPRRYAFRLGHRFPVLTPETQIPNDVLTSAKYFVTLSLGRLDSSLVAEPVPPRSAVWERVDDQLSPLLRRLDPSTVDALFRGRPSRVRRPVRNDAEESTEAKQTRALTLADRRSLPERKLVTKRILRRRE